MKKTVCIILCLVICLGVLAGCTPKKPDPVDPNPSGETEYYDEISVYIMDKVAIVDALNPGGRSASAGVFSRMLYDTLLRFTADNKYEPGLATKWSTEDNKTFNFKLREGVKFHNGENFTADDVAFTVERAKEAPGTMLYDSFNQVESWEVVNEYEINLVLKEVNVDFFYDTAMPLSVMLSRKAYEADPEKGPWVGTGPYKMEKFVPSDSITVTAFDGYWEEMGPTKTFVFRTVGEEAARLIMLENDEFTYCDINSVYIPQYEKDDRFVLNSYTMDNCNYIAFNMKKPVTGDKNFRLAVAYAVNRQDIMDIALGGYGKVVETDALWGNNTNYKNREIPLREQDLEKAKEYLAQSSYKGELIKITASMTHTIRSAEVLLGQLQAIGINAEVQKLDAPSFTAASSYDNNDLDIIVGSGSWTPLASSVNKYVTYSNTNKACYKNPEIEELVKKANATPDGPEREKLYYRIQEILYEDVPYIGTFHMALYIAAQKGAEGQIYYPTNYHDYTKAYRVKL